VLPLLSAISTARAQLNLLRACVTQWDRVGKCSVAPCWLGAQRWRCQQKIFDLTFLLINI